MWHVLWRNQRIITTQPQSSEYHRQITLYEEHASSELAQAGAAVSQKDREINALGHDVHIANGHELEKERLRATMHAVCMPVLKEPQRGK